MKSLKHALPLVLFMFVVALLWRGLTLHPAEIPSPLINKPAPAFALHTLANPERIVSAKNFRGQVTLFHVWASWCHVCAEESSFLLQIARDRQVILYGLNYKDDPRDAKNFLAEHGNPYRLIAMDSTGNTAINWGVYGTPETFVIDKRGVIRYKQIGAITPSIWQRKIKPLLEQLWSEP